MDLLGSMPANLVLHWAAGWGIGYGLGCQGQSHPPLRPDLFTSPPSPDQKCPCSAHLSFHWPESGVGRPVGTQISSGHLGQILIPIPCLVVPPWAAWICITIWHVRCLLDCPIFATVGFLREISRMWGSPACSLEERFFQDGLFSVQAP